MPNNVQIPPETGVIELLSDIIRDVHEVLTQQWALVRHELHDETSHVLEAGSLMVAGLAIALTGTALICAMLVHLLARIVSGLPLWGCYGIVGTPIVILGCILCSMGVQKFRRLNTPRIDLPPKNKEQSYG